ncbi:MAG: VOC family protein [Pseudomonadota bacterium]
MTEQLIRSAAVLQVRDVVASAKFYRESLGFTGHSLWGEPPCFGIVGRGTVTVFLDQIAPDKEITLNHYWAAYIYVEDVNALVDEFRNRGAEILREPEDQPYGCRDFDVRDLDGHVIAFGQDLVPGPAGPGL